MKSGIEFFIAFLIVAWGIVSGVEVSRVVLVVQNLHAYRDYAVYTIEHHNGMNDNVRKIVDANTYCPSCTFETKQDKGRIYVLAKARYEINALMFDATLDAEGTAYIGK